MKILGSQLAACRLCGTHTKLCKSHIVPEFCYSYEQSGHNRFALECLVSAGGGLPKTEIIHKGYREYLLCLACEQAINKYEKVFWTFWKTKILSIPSFTPGQNVVIRGVDYHSIKLFILSVFWRASVAELFGQAMSLGPYAEKLRLILYEDSPVDQTHYIMWGDLIVDDAGRLCHGWVTQPWMVRFDTVRAYSMLFAGCKWTVVMSDHWVPRKLEPLQHVLSKDGRLFLDTQHFKQNPILRQMSQRLKANGG
jgi:hypothetical protein